jgi:lipopolysaccharide/colanic/teichoic acid biosynthesis glycosyltransferase
LRPCLDKFLPLPGHTLVYYEMTGGWLRRWPQLWSVVCGEFAWVGNRPLNPSQASQLANEFERLWLAASPGLLSLGDAEGCTDIHSDEARAHASFYAVQMSRQLDISIIFRVLFIFIVGLPYSTVREVISRSSRRLKIKDQPLR